MASNGPNLNSKQKELVERLERIRKRRAATSLKKGLETISSGRTRLNIEILNWDKKSVEMNKMVNRVVFAIIIASLVLASAVIIVSARSAALSNLSIVIFLGAGFMGLWLLISIIKSGTL